MTAIIAESEGGARKQRHLLEEIARETGLQLSFPIMDTLKKKLK